MPTTYQTCGAAIEKVGPGQHGARPIAFCADSHTAELLCDAINLLKSVRLYGMTVDNAVDTAVLLTKAGLI